MHLSLIVCTRNRAASLERALASYGAISSTYGWELVLVDNGSTDDTPEQLAAFAASSKVPARIVVEPRAGLSRARNRGLAASVGEVVAFTDDDCYPQTDFVDAVAGRFLKDSIDFLGGRVLLYDPDDLPVTIQEWDQDVRIPPASFVRPGLIHGANMAFRRRVLMEVGGFDERLGAGAAFKAGEDTDAIARCVTAGYAGVYAPETIVHHHHGRKTQEEAEKLRDGYAVGRAAYMVKQCIDRRSRRVYVSQWYWRLRQASWRVRRQEFFASLRFLLYCRFRPMVILRHPCESLGP